MRKILMIRTVLAAVIVILVAIVVWRLATARTEIHYAQEGRMEITPVQIEKIKSIGQWEFLSISDEEIADTIRHGFFGDDELSRIYYGTLRLGIDFSEAPEGWIKMDDDTVMVTMPPVKLLDDKFVDEAATKSFIEDGKWSEADRAALTAKAEAAMRRRCLTKQNYNKAKENGKKQLTQLINALGFKYVKVE
jgi:hypothetical protein